MNASLAVRALLALAMLLPLPALAQRGPAPDGPKSVGVIEISQESVPFTVELPGRAVAFEQADIRPRVEGMIVDIPYAPGRDVAVGDVLFRLERDSYAAQATAAEAAVSQAESALRAAQVTLQRYERLEGSGVTQETVEGARVAELQAQATLKSAQAALQTAQLDLDRTEIRSPIAGVADVPAVSVGALVTAAQADSLTTVTRLDPIYVDVAESSARMLRVRERIKEGSLRPGEKVQMTLTLENGQIYDATGEVISPGVLVSQSTGTLNIRVKFPNPNRDIMPGQFLRMEAILGTTDGILVPQRATSRSSTGVLTAFVVRDGKAVQVTLTDAGSHGNAWIVTDGLDPGDRLVVDGLKNLRNGDEVAPVAVTIDADGLTHPVAATGEPPAPAAAGPAPAQGN
jgi:membrane fusion protein (multidrug efflux system)